MWSAISNFGDAAMTLPLALVCAVWLAQGSGGWRAAGTWLGLVATAAALVGATKILYAGCGVELRALQFRVISGHTMLAASVWPMACILCLRARPRPRLAVAGGLAIASVIAIARVYARAHSLSEVAVGVVVGAATTACYLRWHGAPQLPARLRVYAILSVGLVAVLMYGRHAPIQHAIQAYSPALCGRDG
ncbi:membrane-associated phospholipid phosphatase [Xanthomonas sacchari]|uniref:phosphatase PAP2 family protein n=1 Tax=unclassified Xanthomonas TaxID=2643310 RepID=UPI001367D252|nr:MULTISPECIES: phosphatase PAP2 family protein [unclassified Xanthomonas]MBB6366992.1 membrane-associated phospholipid phosphatase [Xanthomonas sp. F10]MXV33915.1 phosphatase PAP2 family protein [Xanthomonas sp. LMG 8989]